MLVSLDGALVDGDVLHVELDCGTFLRNPDRSVVVACPSGHGVERIEDVVLQFRCKSYALHYCLVCREGLCRTLCQRHIAVLVQAGQVFHADAQLLHHFVGDGLVELHLVCVLHVVWLLVRLAVKIYNVVLYLQGHSRQTHAALHVVLAAVGGAGYYLAELLRVCCHILSSCVIYMLEVVVALLRIHGGEVHRLFCEQLVSH